MKRSIVSVLLILSSVYVFAQGEIFQIGNSNNYIAGVITSKFQYSVARQEKDNWCWAACIEMVLHYQGINVSQDDLVNQGANCSTITEAADGWSVGSNEIIAWAEYEASADDLVEALAYKYPVIIGLDMPGQNTGHAYVLTAIYYKYDENVNIRPYKVILRDPWPYSPSKEELSWNDFSSRINCIVHVTF